MNQAGSVAPNSVDACEPPVRITPMLSRLNPILYVVCGLTDFAAFVVVFTVSRKLAEIGSPPWYLGVVGAGLSLSAGLGSCLGGWLAHRFDGRVVFLSCAAPCILSVARCGLVDPASLR